MTRRIHAALLLAALAVATGEAAPRPAESAPSSASDSAEAYVQNVTDGYIDWGSGEVGSWGYAPRTTSSAKETRKIRDMKIAAERSARANLLAILQRARASSEARVGDRPDLVERVKGIVKAAIVAEEHPVRGGLIYGVFVVAPLWGADGIAWSVYEGAIPSPERAEAAPPGAVAGTPAAPPADGPTGIVIDARGTGLRPAILPRILDDQGGVLSSAETVDREAVKERGMASYIVEPAAASSLRERIGERPLWVFAAKEASGATPPAPAAANPAAAEGPPREMERPGPTPRQGRRPYRTKASGASGPLAADVILRRADAEKIRAMPGGADLLEQCRVVIIVDRTAGAEG